MFFVSFRKETVNGVRLTVLSVLLALMRMLSTPNPQPSRHGSWVMNSLTLSWYLPRYNFLFGHMDGSFH